MSERPIAASRTEHPASESYEVYQPAAAPLAERATETEDAYQVYKQYHPAVEELVVTEGEDTGRVKDPEVAHEIAVEPGWPSTEELSEKKREKRFSDSIKRKIARRAIELLPEEEKDEQMKYLMDAAAGLGVARAGSDYIQGSEGALNSAKQSVNSAAGPLARVAEESVRDYAEIEAQGKEYHHRKKLERPARNLGERVLRGLNRLGSAVNGETQPK